MKFISKFYEACAAMAGDFAKVFIMTSALMGQIKDAYSAAEDMILTEKYAANREEIKEAFRTFLTAIAMFLNAIRNLTKVEGVKEDFKEVLALETSMKTILGSSSALPMIFTSTNQAMKEYEQERQAFEGLILKEFAPEFEAITMAVTGHDSKQPDESFPLSHLAAWEPSSLNLPQ